MKQTMDCGGYHCCGSGYNPITFTKHYNFIIPRCDTHTVEGEMTHNTHAEDAWKNHEENAEAVDTVPEPDEQTEALSRHEGTVTTVLGNLSVSDLMANVQ